MGELRYVVGHALGRASCSLCDVTHGALRPKRAWLDASAHRLPAPIRLIHRDERTTAEAAASAGGLPCVLARRGDAVEVVLGPEALAACEGDVDRFVAAIASACA